MRNLLSALLLTACSLYPEILSAQETSKPFILGETISLHSKIIDEERTLNIYLPEGYEDSDATRFPVIYLLDGSADEDFIHVAGLVQYNSFPWVNRLKPSIVVGIANTDRKRDMTFPSDLKEDQELVPGNGGSEKFMAFIEDELKPFVNKRYRTNDEETIIGQSLAGLFATEVLLKKPDLFDIYILISPSLWWNNGSLLSYPPDFLIKNKTVYIGAGNEGMAPGTQARVMEEDARNLASRLEENGVPVLFDYMPEEDHATAGHQAVSNAFRLINELKGKSGQ